MRILVTNDDGIEAKGIMLLAKAAKEFGDVVVVAPENQQSAASHGLTVTRHVEVNEVRGFLKGVESYTANGKPADCVNRAIRKLNIKPDLVLSGVNDGANIGRDILYSGTIGAAMEAAIHGIPAIAFSTDVNHFDIVEEELVKVIKFVLKRNLAKAGMVVNVNFPQAAFGKSKGVIFTRQGRNEYAGTYKDFDTENSIERPIDKESDLVAFENGYISITPLLTNRTDNETLNAWKGEIK